MTYVRLAANMHSAPESDGISFTSEDVSYQNKAVTVHSAPSMKEDGLRQSPLDDVLHR